MISMSRTSANELTHMAEGHFRNLTKLATKTQGAVEMGRILAQTEIGEHFTPDPCVIEKMASKWAENTFQDYEPEIDIEKLATAVLNDGVLLEDLTEKEKVALGKILSGIGGGLKRGVNFFTKGRGLPDTIDVAKDVAKDKPKKWLTPWKKLQIGATGVGVGGIYLGGKALDTARAFLEHQPRGTAYQYGGGSPSHFMRPQMGM